MRFSRVMPRSEDEIARQFTEELLRKHSKAAPEAMYRTISALDDHPDLTNVRLTAQAIRLKTISFMIQATYTGPQEFMIITHSNKDEAKASADEFYRDLAEKTGLTFYSACPTTAEPAQYTALVQVADKSGTTIAIRKPPKA